MCSFRASRFTGAQPASAAGIGSGPPPARARVPQARMPRAAMAAGGRACVSLARVGRAAHSAARARRSHTQHGRGTRYRFTSEKKSI